jgi:hypothetical protein
LQRNFHEVTAIAGSVTLRAKGASGILTIQQGATISAFADIVMLTGGAGLNPTNASEPGALSFPPGFLINPVEGVSSANDGRVFFGKGVVSVGTNTAFVGLPSRIVFNKSNSSSSGIFMMGGVSLIAAPITHTMPPVSFNTGMRADSELVNSSYATIVSRTSEFHQDRNVIAISFGEILIAAKSDLSVRTPHSTMNFKRGSIALLWVEPAITRIDAVHETRAMHVKIGPREVLLHSGQSINIECENSAHLNRLKDCRKVKKFGCFNGMNVTTGEHSVLALAYRSPLVSSTLNKPLDSQAKWIAHAIRKTAASLFLLTASHGSFGNSRNSD